ncbi:pyridoxal-phosphate dependent enzyme [Ochrobactrum sp. XJ1]|nr:pyridoxal-phosphate dependent enzyme [Ochrobactrum sp. XJ1]
MKAYQSAVDGMRHPQLFKIQTNLTMLSFKAMKIVPAYYIITQALARGELLPGATIVETSSGNFGVGMAMVCNMLGHPFVIIGDPAIDDSYRQQLTMLGGKVEIITDKKGSQGYQKARLDRVQEILGTESGSFWCRQYDNPDNAKAYEKAGISLLDQIGTELILVAAVGSGGSSCGLAHAIRSTGANCTLVGVDTFNSILFGQMDGPRRLRGLGNTVMPKNLCHNLFDYVHWVSSELADYQTRKLYSTTGHFRGPTTGAAYLVASYLATENPQKQVVFVSPDDGSRYATSTYAESLVDKSSKPIRPLEFACPRENNIGIDWAFMNWNRRNIME